MKLFIQLLFIIIFVFLFSCNIPMVKNSERLENNEAKDSIFTVCKIDSINNYYIIYLKRNDNWFKVVSKKDLSQNSRKKIINKKSYFFSLHSIWNEKMIINGKEVSLLKTPNVECIGFDEKTSICIERDSINDLYTSKNLRGLEYLKIQL